MRFLNTQQDYLQHDKTSDRDRIRLQTEQYLAEGGTIQEIAPGESHDPRLTGAKKFSFTKNVHVEKSQ